MSTPSQYFEDFVLPNIEAWEKAPLCEWKAQNAINELNNMAERYWHYWKDLDRSKIYETKTVGRFRQHLCHRSPWFKLLLDIAEAHKHVRLDRKPRIVTNSSQTGLGHTGGALAGLGLASGPIGGGTTGLLVRLNDGSSRDLMFVITNVTLMWRQMIETHA
jgi:hypothetical protein